jgi:hypothetical protein
MNEEFLSLRVDTMNTLKLINITEQSSSADGVYHLAYYHPPKAGEQDQISKYLLDFEDGQEPQTTQWIRLAALLVSQSLSFDVIVRPVSQNEFNAKKPSSLEKLCIAISRKSGAKYQRNRLQRTKSANRADFNRPGELVNGCADSYTFGDEYSVGVSEVLVVDDFLVNEATLAAITTSVHEKLPKAKVLFFALGRIEENEQNSHLDARYFTSTTSPMPADLKPAKGNRTKVVPHVPRHPARKALPVTSPSVHPSLRIQSPHHQGVDKKEGVALRRVGVGGALLISAFGLLLVSGGYVLLANRRPINSENFYQVPALTVVRTDAPVVEDAVKPVVSDGGRRFTEPDLPAGIITVPSVGLRAEHYIDSKILKIKVRNGEKVYIVKKVSSSTGPRWMQIRTKSGKVGWVWASVVRVVRPRILAAR